MTGRPSHVKEEAWALVERERRTDRFVRRVSVAAWIVTFVIVVLFTVATGYQVAQFWPAARGEAGQMSWILIMGSLYPLFIVLGLLAVLIATLSTVAMFFRQRTASLTEIQTRLDALEQMLMSSDERR